MVGESKVVVTLGAASQESEDRVMEARREMEDLLARHIGCVPASTLLFIESGFCGIDVSPTFRCWSSQLFAERLIVSHDSGVGLDLEPEPAGMRVRRRHGFPRQKNVREGDLIFEIDGNMLCGTLAIVEQLFGTHLRDGVQIGVKRSGSGEPIVEDSRHYFAVASDEIDEGRAREAEHYFSAGRPEASLAAIEEQRRPMSWIFRQRRIVRTAPQHRRRGPWGLSRPRKPW
eukprot:TRINITY_DN40370_c0_g1_i1.p2 TRINITY_DN40370_c0_g1~~TRINITY_DN40370_c0_g1_i1.p2  ORF type:complete len:253 (+),score=44.52 TRINITY_DN40370_c0_g1_i1:71-760(+)